MAFDEMQALFGIAGGVLGFIDYLIYARSVLRGRTKPNAATWIGTSAVWFVALISYFLVGARDTLWFVIASTAGSFLVALLTVRYGVKWQRSDFVCLTGAAGVGALGFLTESPLTALFAAMAVDFLALFPTVAKTWRHPNWEEPFPWIVTVVASVLTVMAVATSLGSPDRGISRLLACHERCRAGADLSTEGADFSSLLFRQS